MLLHFFLQKRMANCLRFMDHFKNFILVKFCLIFNFKKHSWRYFNLPLLAYYFLRLLNTHWSPGSSYSSNESGFMRILNTLFYCFFAFLMLLLSAVICIRIELLIAQVNADPCESVSGIFYPHPDIVCTVPVRDLVRGHVNAGSPLQASRHHLHQVPFIFILDTVYLNPPPPFPSARRDRRVRIRIQGPA